MGKKKFRSITVSGLPFRYWHGETRDKQWSLVRHELHIRAVHAGTTPGMGNHIILVFPLEGIPLRESRGTLGIALPGAVVPDGEEETQTPPYLLVPYDTDHLYAAKAYRNGVEELVDWGKPASVAAITSHLLDTGRFAPAPSQTQILNGWETLQEMGYSEFTPVMNWGWT